MIHFNQFAITVVLVFALGCALGSAYSNKNDLPDGEPGMAAYNEVRGKIVLCGECNPLSACKDFKEYPVDLKPCKI